MTIRQQGGVFGRNPSFNDVEMNDLDANIGLFNRLGVNVTGTTARPAEFNTSVRIADGAVIEWGGITANITGSSASNTLFFRTGGTEAGRFDSSKNLDLTYGGGNVMLASGAGIDFSATSGTGTSELFDDYEEGTWTPAFSAEFTTAPTVTSAQYTKVGRQVTVTMLATDGVVTAGGSITGLPFTSNSTQGVGAYGGNSDTTESIQGTVGQSASSITNIPARTLTGDTWQITATYFT